MASHTRVLISVVAGAFALCLGVVILKATCRRDDAAAKPTSEGRLDEDIRAARQHVIAADAVRRAALQPLVKLSEFPTASGPCPADTAVGAWSNWSDFADAPSSYDLALKFTQAWDHLSSFQGSGVVNVWQVGGSFDGPRAYHAETNLDLARDWDKPTSAGTPWMTIEQAAHRVRELGRIETWDFDATLVIHELSGPRYLDEAAWDTGALSGTLWLWSYRDRVFICMAPVRLSHATLAGVSRSDGERLFLENALWMRAVAMGMRILRRVTID